MALPSPLYVILDLETLERAGWEPLAFLDACLDGGARLFQLRAKALGAGALAALAGRMLDRLGGTGGLLVINDRVDEARVTGAGGAHVGQEDLDVAAARTLLGDRAMLGLSTHTAPQVDAAVGGPATYVAVGPVFGTASKDTGYAPVGLALVSKAREAAGRSRPLVAIGGITRANAASVVAAGADAVAVIGDLVDTDPASRVRAFLDVLTR